MNLAPNTHIRLIKAVSNRNLNKFSYDCLRRRINMLVDNSHTLYITKYSISFLITIHTVAYHSKPQSLMYIQTVAHYSQISHCFFLYFPSHTVPFYCFTPIHTIFQISYNPSPSTSFFSI